MLKLVPEFDIRLQEMIYGLLTHVAAPGPWGLVE